MANWPLQLQVDAVFMQWTMQPVLSHLRPRLGGKVRALLTALVAAPGNPECLAELDKFPAWREAKPEPLE